MRVTLSGKNIETGESLKRRVEERLTKAVEKYFDFAINADAVFSKQGHFFHADLMVNEGVRDGLTIKASAEADDIYAAFELALEKIEKRLRRYKRKIKDHHKKSISELPLAE